MTACRMARWSLVVALASAAGFATGPSARAQPPAPCAVWEVEYTLAGDLQLTETPMKQADGTYPVGPGRVVLRFEDKDGQPGGRASMISYSLNEHFTVKSQALFWTTTIVVDARSRGTPGPSGAAAEGILRWSTLEWGTPVRGYRTDGSATCDGALCGKFGAPRPGQSELHILPGPVQFRPFEFAEDLKSFTMPYTFVSETDAPKQRSRLALSGQEARRSCLKAAE